MSTQQTTKPTLTFGTDYSEQRQALINQLQTRTGLTFEHIDSHTMQDRGSPDRILLTDGYLISGKNRQIAPATLRNVITHTFRERGVDTNHSVRIVGTKLWIATTALDALLEHGVYNIRRRAPTIISLEFLDRPANPDQATRQRQAEAIVKRLHNGSIPQDVTARTVDENDNSRQRSNPPIKGGIEIDRHPELVAKITELLDIDGLAKSIRTGIAHQRAR